MIFISYARHDAKFALTLASDLRKAEVPVWIDQADIPAGAQWDRAVEVALNECSGVVVVLSPDAVASRSVMDEVSLALDQQKSIYPVVCKECAIPFRLRRLQHVDCAADYSSGAAKLISELSGKPAIGVRDESRSPSGPTAAATRGRLRMVLTLALGGAVIAGAATFLIFANDPRFRGVVGFHNSLLAWVLLGALWAGSGWAITGGLVPLRSKSVLGTVLASAAAVVAWVLLFGTYQDVIFAAFLFGAPLAGILTALAFRIGGRKTPHA